MIKHCEFWTGTCAATEHAVCAVVAGTLHTSAWSTWVREDNIPEGAGQQVAWLQQVTGMIRTQQDQLAWQHALQQLAA